MIEAGILNQKAKGKGYLFLSEEDDLLLIFCLFWFSSFLSLPNNFGTPEIIPREYSRVVEDAQKSGYFFVVISNIPSGYDIAKASKEVKLRNKAKFRRIILIVQLPSFLLFFLFFFCVVNAGFDAPRLAMEIKKN